METVASQIKTNRSYEKKAMIKAKTNLVYFGIFAVIMLFGGLTSAYVVSNADRVWVVFDMPQLFWISTFIIIASSITMFLAHKSAKKNHPSRVKIFLLLTLLLGIAFSLTQYYGWKELYGKGYAFSEHIFNPDNPNEFFMQGEYGKDFVIKYKGEVLNYENGMFSNSNGVLSEKQYAKLKDSKNVSSSYFYLITAVHLLHIVVALLYILSLFINSLNNIYNPDNQLGLKLGGIFWHFLGILWIYLFLFLYFIH